MYKILKYFEKGQVIACDYCTQQTARIGPVGHWKSEIRPPNCIYNYPEITTGIYRTLSFKEYCG